MKRKLNFIAATFAALVLALGAAVYVYLGTASFQRRAEARVVARIAAASGARVEIGGFHLGLRPLTIDIDNLVLHGRESAAQAPLAVVPHLRLELRLVTLIGPEIELAGVWVGEPRVHVFTLADGASNLPRPPTPASGVDYRTGPLYSMGIKTLTISRGQLDLEQRRIQLDLELRDVGLEVRAAAAGTYAGRLRFSGATLRYANWPLLRPSVMAEFTVGGDELTIRQLTVTDSVGRAVIRATVHDFARPVIDGTYQVDADLAAWSRILGMRELAAGRTQAAGGFHGSTGAPWFVRGQFTAAGLRLTRGLPDGVWRAAGGFDANAAGLTLPHIHLEGPAGTVEVALGYNHWRDLQVAATAAGARLSSLLPLVPPGELDARLLSPLHSLEARVDGSLHLLGHRAAAGVSIDRLELAATLTPEPAAARTAVSGSLQAEWSGGALRLTQLALTLPAASVTAQGQLNGAASSVAFHFAATDLAVLRPWLAPWVPDPAALASLRGAGSADGTVAGSIPSLRLAATLQLTGLGYDGYRADALSAAFELSPRQLILTRFSGRDGQQRLTASGSLGLDRYRLAPASLLNLQVQASALDLARLEALAGLRYPIGGRATVRVTVTGTRQDPAAHGSFQIQQAHWQNQAVRSVSADFNLQDRQWTANDFAFALTRTRVSGQLELNLRDRTYRLDLSSPNLRLAEVAELQSPRLPVQGQAQFHLTGAGAWDDPQASLTLRTTNLRGAGESLGNIVAEFRLDRASVQVNATDTLPNGSVRLAGTAGIAAPYPVDLHLDLKNYDFDALLRRFTPADITGHSNVSGRATLQGPLGRPAELQANIALDPIEVAINGMSIHNQGPVELSVTSHQLRLLPAHIVAPDTDFTLEGGVELPNAASLAAALGGRLQGAVQGTINLALVHALDANTRAAGQVQVTAQAAGTVGQPLFTGTVAIRNASVAEDNLPVAFDNIQGQLRLAGSRIQIEKLTASTGGGQLSLTGFAGHAASGYNFDLSASGQNLRFRFQGISATGDLQLRLSGQRNSALLAGKAQLNRLSLSQDFDLAVFIANTQTPSAPPAPDSLLNRVRVDVRLTTGPQVEIATNLAHMELQGDLRLGGTLADPAILGRATASEGKVLFAGNEYEVDKAQVQFANPFKIEPILDVGLSTTVQQYDVTLNVSGPVDKMSISYRSDPPLSNADIVALLATGAPTQASAALSQAAASSVTGQSEQLLGQALDNIVAGRLQRLFGITQVQVNPNNGTVGPNGYGSTVTIQQQVSRQLKVTYIQNLSSSSQDIVQVDWTINKELGATLMRDQFGLYGLKFTFRQRVR